MLMENHMTLQLPLSGSILNPIDMDQVWKRLERRWCRHLIPTHENSLFFSFFLSLFSGYPRGPWHLAVLCSQRWMWTSICYNSCWDTPCQQKSRDPASERVGLRCFSVPIKVRCCVFTLGRHTSPRFQGAYCTWRRFPRCQLLLSDDPPALGGYGGGG